MGYNINGDYKKLKSRAASLEAKIYDAEGLVSLANQLKKEMDSVSKAYKNKEHYKSLNEISTKYNSSVVEFKKVLDQYKNLLYDAATEYEKARTDSMSAAKKL